MQLECVPNTDTSVWPIELDSHYTLINQDKLIHHIMNQFIYPNEKRRRERTPKQNENHLKLLNCLLANLARLITGKANTIRYSRSPKSYSKNKYGYYLASFMSWDALKSTLLSLEKAGLINNTIASNDYDNVGKKQSTFEPSVTLKLLYESFNLSKDDVRFDYERSPLITLKNKQKQRLSIDMSNNDIAKMDLSLREINKHITQFDLMLDGQSLENTHLNRVFNNSSFNHNGRFYGGSWQSLKKSERPHLLIDNTSTIELDYSGCLTRMIYHHCNIELNTDPYEIPAAREFLSEAVTTNRIQQRDIIKQLVNPMLNTHNRNIIPNPIWVSETAESIEVHSVLRTNITKLLVEAILDHHAQIKDYFFKSKGLEFMYYESLICEAILLRSINDNIPVLPIHDSFITVKPREEWLEEVMVEEYQKHLGFKPVIH